MADLATATVVAGAVGALTAGVWEWRRERRAWLLVGILISVVLALDALVGPPTPSDVGAVIVVLLAAAMIGLLVTGR